MEPGAIDKSSVASVDGLGAKLKVTKGNGSVTIQVEEGFDPDRLEEPILRTHDVSAELESILSVDVNAPGRAADLNTFVDWLADEYGAGREIPPSPGGQCKRCEFYCPPEEISDEHRSGWSECMAASFNQHHGLPRSATVFGLWNYRKADERLKTGVLALAAFTERDLPHEAEPGKVTRNDRHWLQVAEARQEGEPRYLEGDSLLSAFSGWKFPLHFIDFETARPPLPFHIGHRPHQGLLFQFSHHVLELDGSLRHADECLVAAPGIEPSVSVLRALQDALAGDDGTVVHWWDHERSFLKEIRRQVEASGEPDRKELTAFIDSLVGIEGQAGRLADLGRLVLNTAFFQGTSGSSSIKKVLPAVLAQSDFLKERYGKPIYGTDRMLSLNFPVGWTWLKEDGGQVIDPYQLLAPMFVDRALREAVAQAEDDDTGDQDFIANGGAAMVAYGELQQRDLPAGERTRLEDQLKRYCELDTLAMVMIYEALVDWIR